MPEYHPSFDAELLRVWWIVSAMLVLLMQLGFICLEMGCVSEKSRPGIAVKNFVMLIVSAAAFTLIGSHLMLGTPHSSGLFGFGPLQLWLEPGTSERGPNGSYGWLFFQTGFAAVAATILSGALAGRTTLVSNAILAAVMGVVIYPIFGHWIWGGGWLQELGAYDFAGSGAVHYIGGVTAFLAAKMAGPRSGFIRDGKVQDVVPKSMPFATVGVVFLWVGWIGFNGGSILPDPHFSVDGENGPVFLDGNGFGLIGMAVLATSIAASGGGLAVIMVAGFFHWKYGRGKNLSLRDALHQRVLFDPWATLGGTMGGMVAITANCDWLFDDFGHGYLWAALVIGAIGGVAASAVAYVVTNVLRVDDPVEAVGVHAGGGAAGILIASFSSKAELANQVMVLAAGVTWVVIVAYPCLYALRRFGLLRATATEEELGLTFESYETSVFTAEMISARREAEHP